MEFLTMCAKQRAKYPKYILELRRLPLDGTAESVQHQFATGGADYYDKAAMPGFYSCRTARK